MSNTPEDKEQDSTAQAVADSNQDNASPESKSQESGGRDGKKAKEEQDEGVTAKDVALALAGDTSTPAGRRKRRRQRKRLFSCFRRVTKCIRDEVEEDEDFGDCCCGCFSDGDDGDE